MLGAARAIAIVGEEGGRGAPGVALPLLGATHSGGGRRLRTKCANRQKKKHNSSSATTSTIHQSESGSGGSPVLGLGGSAMMTVQSAQLKAQASAMIGSSHAGVPANVSHRPPTPTVPQSWTHTLTPSASFLSTNALQLGMGSQPAQLKAQPSAMIGSSHAGVPANTSHRPPAPTVPHSCSASSLLTNAEQLGMGSQPAQLKAQPSAMIGSSHAGVPANTSHRPPAPTVPHSCSASSLLTNAEQLGMAQPAQLKAQASAMIGSSHTGVPANVSHRPSASTVPHIWTHALTLSASSLSTNAEQGGGAAVGREEDSAVEIVGLTVGLAVRMAAFALGLAVGSLVGFMVGLAVVGMAEGMAVGALVGLIAGPTDGEIVELSDGVMVVVVGLVVVVVVVVGRSVVEVMMSSVVVVDHHAGENVGLTVGLMVGRKVGLAVGVMVGLVVGFTVGVMVGLVVGELVGLVEQFGWPHNSGHRWRTNTAIGVWPTQRDGRYEWQSTSSSHDTVGNAVGLTVGLMVGEELVGLVVQFGWPQNTGHRWRTNTAMGL